MKQIDLENHKHQEPGQTREESSSRSQVPIQAHGSMPDQPQSRQQGQQQDQDQALRLAAELAILIVEDDFIINMYIESILSGRGYRVAGVASRGAEAIQLAHETSPGLILMDIGLSGPLDGLATALEIRAWSEVPIVFMTGNAVQVRSDERLVRIRPAAILSKPFDDIRLLAQIATLFPQFKT